MSIADFAAGGMKPETAAHFTRGELLAIYRGRHFSRNASGASCITLPPENIAGQAAMAKCDEGLREILNYCSQNAQEEAAVNAETKKEDIHMPAPENTPRRTGLEGLKNYVKEKRS